MCFVKRPQAFTHQAIVRYLIRMKRSQKNDAIYHLNFEK